MRVTGDRVGVVDGNGEWHRPGYGDDGVTTVLYRAAEVFPTQADMTTFRGQQVYAVRANYDATGAAFVTTGRAEGLTGDGWVPLAPGSTSDVPGPGR